MEQEGDAEAQAPDAEEQEAAESGLRPLMTSIALERTYRINGKRVTVQAVLPPTVARAIGMEAAYEAARRLILRVESQEAKIEEVPVGRTPPKEKGPAKTPPKGKTGDKTGDKSDAKKGAQPGTKGGAKGAAHAGGARSG